MGSKWGPMGFYTNLDPYGPNPSPNGPMAIQNKPYFTFSEGRFRTFPTDPGNFSENVPKMGPIFFGTKFPRRRELQIDGVKMPNGATAAIFRPNKLLGSKSTTPLS